MMTCPGSGRNEAIGRGLIPFLAAGGDRHAAPMTGQGPLSLLGQRVSSRGLEQLGFRLPLGRRPLVALGLRLPIRLTRVLLPALRRVPIPGELLLTSGHRPPPLAQPLTIFPPLGCNT